MFRGSAARHRALHSRHEHSRADCSPSFRSPRRRVGRFPVERQRSLLSVLPRERRSPIKPKQRTQKQKSKSSWESSPIRDCHVVEYCYSLITPGECKGLLQEQTKVWNAYYG